MFKPGDRVRRLLASAPEQDVWIGEIYVVRGVEGFDLYLEQKGNYRFLDSLFELVEDESTMKYQPGDEVTIKVKVIEPSNDIWMTTCEIISEDIVRMPTPGSKWVAKDGSGSSCEVHAVVNGKVFRTKVGPSGQKPATGSVDLKLFHGYWELA